MYQMYGIILICILTVAQASALGDSVYGIGRRLLDRIHWTTNYTTTNKVFREIKINEYESGSASPTSTQPNIIWTATNTMPIMTSTSTPLSEGKPLRYVLNPVGSYKYELTVDSSNNQTLYTTMNICDMPYSSTPFDTNFTVGELPMLFVSNTNVSDPILGSTMDGLPAIYGFANITVQVTSSTMFAEVIAPQVLSSNLQGSWTYEIAMSTTGPVHGVVAGPNLYLVDTDFADALFVTGNYTGDITVNDYELFIYSSSSSNNGLFYEQLGASYCAVSNGPSLENTMNVQITNTTRGSGDTLKGQYVVSQLNKSTSYYAYLTQPNDGGNLSLAGSSGGLIFNPPVEFSTKSDENCQLVYDLDFCSGVAYAVPGNASAFNMSQLSQFYDTNAQALYQNFSYSLQNVPCNASNETRYSILRNCDDCAVAYGQWLCAVTIPRCADWSSNESFLYPRPVGTSRNPLIDQVIQPGNYKEILPCVNLCYNLMEGCDSSLQFTCPQQGKGLEQSYGQLSDNGTVSCSYPGALYYTNAATRLSLAKMQTAGLLLIISILTTLLYI